MFDIHEVFNQSGESRQLFVIKLSFWIVSSPQGLNNKAKLYLFVVELLPKKRLFAILHGLVFQKKYQENENNRSEKGAAGCL